MINVLIHVFGRLALVVALLGIPEQTINDITGLAPVIQTQIKVFITGVHIIPAYEIGLARSRYV